MWRIQRMAFYQRLTAMLLCLNLTGIARAEVSNAPDAGPAAVARKTMTLAAVKRLALARNWDLLTARSEVDLATAQRIIAREFPNPTLTVLSSKINVDGRSNSTPAGNGVWDRSYDSVIAINQLFEVGGKRTSRQASALAGFRSAEARFNDARRLLDLAVTKAYIDALLAEADVQILNQSAATLRQEAGMAETRLNAGDISLADKSQIEITAGRLELGAKAAEAAASAARISLEVLMGSNDPKDDWAPGDTLQQLAELPPSAAQVEPGASRPDLIAAEAALQKSEADLKLQRAFRIPDPTFLVQFEHEPPDQPNTIGIGVSLPLPLWNRNKGGISAARAAQEQAVAQVRKVQSQIAGEIQAARIVYAGAAERWRRHRDEIQPKSAEIRKTVSFAYEKGGASLLDLLSAERNDNDVRLATAQSAADTATAAVTLNSALNLADPETNSK
jgi:cobalt-zinc-cadmium efflux system outer membrane protein